MNNPRKEPILKGPGMARNGLRNVYCDLLCYDLAHGADGMKSREQQNPC